MTKRKPKAPAKETYTTRKGGTVTKPKPTSETTNETDKA